MRTVWGLARVSFRPLTGGVVAMHGLRLWIIGCSPRPARTGTERVRREGLLAMSDTAKCSCRRNIGVRAARLIERPVEHDRG